MSLLGGGVLPAPAEAAKCISCEGEEPGEEPEAQILTIEIVGHGSVGNGTKTYCENAGAASKSCQVEFAEGKKATLSATPLGEYVFQGWSGSGCSGTGNCEVTMTEAKSVEATFTNPPPAPPTITSPTSGQVFERSAEEPVSVSFTDGDPTIVEFRCRVDSLPEVSCAPPSWTSPKLGAGEHTVYVSARDGGGNVAVAFRSFKVAINAPPGEEGEPKPEEPGPGSGGAPGSGGTPIAQPVSPGPVDIRPRQIHVSAVVKSRHEGKATIFRKLMLKRLPAGVKALSACLGKGCPYKRKTIPAKNGAADFSAFFADRKLVPGVTILLSAGGNGMESQTIKIRTRAGRAPKVTSG